MDAYSCHYWAQERGARQQDGGIRHSHSGRKDQTFEYVLVPKGLARIGSCPRRHGPATPVCAPREQLLDKGNALGVAIVVM